MGSYGTDGKLDLDKLTTNLQKTGATVTRNGNMLTATLNDYSYIIDGDGNIGYDRTGIEIGDYVNYEPTDGTYESSKLGEIYTGSTTNGTTDLTTNVTSGGTTTKTVANWRVLRIYDDGSMDLIGDSTSYSVYFHGARGYNNGPKVMNDICATLYSNSSKGITARSVDIEDFEVSGRGVWASSKITYISEQISILKTTYDTNLENGTTQNVQGVDTDINTVTYVTGYSKYPNIYAVEKGAGINTTTVNTTENKETLKNNLDTSSNAQYGNANTNGLTTEYTHYNISIDSTNLGDAYKALSTSDTFWLASRCVRCLTNSARLSLRCSNNNLGSSVLFGSNGGSDGKVYHLRPVITIRANIQVTPCTGTNGEGNAHTINW